MHPRDNSWRSRAGVSEIDRLGAPGGQGDRNRAEA